MRRRGLLAQATLAAGPATTDEPDRAAADDVRTDEAQERVCCNYRQLRISKGCRIGTIERAQVNQEAKAVIAAREAHAKRKSKG